jgi:ABC-2 type transport system ATP-binding protein
VVKLGDRIHTKSSELSTGLRQKMNVVRGFLTDPEVLFLDEPTLGLDVGAARDVREFIRQWMRDHPQRTLLLTTHYMAEADDLCDRIAIINHGKVLACDTPGRLKLRIQQHPRFSLELTPLGEADLAWLRTLPGVRGVVHRPGEDRTAVDLTLAEEPALGPRIASLPARGVALITLAKREPTLEEVFVAIVGSGIDEVERDESAAGT